jgi:choline-sulfatase
MMRLVAFGALFGVATGAAEVAIRVRPTQGLGAGDVAIWLVVSVALATAFGVLAAIVAGGIRRPGRKTGAYGLTFAAFLALHAGINYRFEVVLNEFVRDPRVWGGLGAIAVASLVVGVVADRFARRVPRRLFVAVALASSALAFVRVGRVDGVPRRLPNVLVVSLDTTRPDHLGPYGHTIATPNLDRLAREGVVFDQAIAGAPITEPSHLAMFTGLPPVVTGVVSNGTNLGDRPELLWRTLKREGYTTAGFVAGFPLHGKYGWGQGMDVYDDDFGPVAGVQALSLVKAWNQVAVKEHALRERPAAQVLARAAPWIASHSDQQMFAFVHLYDAHGPYDQPTNDALGPAPTTGTPLTLPAYWPPPDRRITDPAWLTRAYDNELVRLDAAIGALLAALGDSLDETIVMVTADHGESLTEHGYYFDHGDNLYDPSLKVPWIVRFPAGATPGTRVPCQVGGVDLVPTVLALVGVPDTFQREGVSRVRELKGGECREQPVVSSTVAGRLVADPPTDHALRGQGRKFILHEGGAVELYDLATDPGEQVNLAPNEVSEPIKRLLEVRIAGGREVAPELDSTTRDMLEQLGYIDGG